MTTAPPSKRPWLIGLGFIALCLVAYLVFADTPADAALETKERLAAGKQKRPEADFVAGLWYAAAINLALTITLMATLKFWLRPLSEIIRGKGFEPEWPARGFFLALAAIVALAGVMRWNLAHGGFWWDELYPVKYGIAGYHLNKVTDPLEERYFADSNWQRALWYYQRPTNHPTASFPARLSHVAWRSFAKPDQPHAFNEFAIRFPNWLAALASVALIGVAAALWNRPLSGLLAALFLALHPWHIRYGIDLRGYTWVILGTAAGLIWLTLILRSKKSRWWPWLGFGLNQALLVWAFPHAVFVAAGFGIVAILSIWHTWTNSSDRRAALIRLVIVNVFAGMLFLQLFAPNLLQMYGWYESVANIHTEHGLDAKLARELMGELFLGMPWALPQNEDSQGLSSLSDLARPFLWIGLGTLTSLIAAGAIRAWLEMRKGALILSAPLLAGAGLLGFFWITRDYFYSRFLVFLLIPFCLLLGIAGDWQEAKKRWAILLAAGGLGVFAWLATPQWRVMLSRPISPMREVARELDVIKAESDRPLVYACYGHGLEMLPVYWPEMRGAINLDDLQKLAEETQAKGGRLLVAYGHSTYNRATLPDGFQWLDDPKRFRRLGIWRGLRPEQTFRLLEWTGNLGE